MSEIFTCNIQKTFNKVINAGMYAPEVEIHYVREWDETINKNIIVDSYYFKNHAMCLALCAAVRVGKISEKDYQEAKTAIAVWLEELEAEINNFSDLDNSAAYLESALQACGMRSDFEFRKSIYLNWDKRPNLALIYRQMMQAKQNIPY